MSRLFSVIDAETNPFEHGNLDIEPFLWGIYDERGFKTFRRTQDLIDFISDNKRIYFAHNGGKFDFHFLLDWVNTYQELTVIHGRIAKSRISEAELRDSFCLLPDKLDNLTDGAKIKIDYQKFRREFREAHIPEITRYLEADCYLLYVKLQEFFEEHPQKPLTLAGAALTWWVKNCNDGKPVMDAARETAKRYYQSLEPWYFGGRVEAMRPGNHTQIINTYDLNSAYPDAMCQDHPMGPHRTLTRNDSKNLGRKVLLIKAKSDGHFCARNDKGGIDFPRDGETRQFHVTGWEFQTALELNARIMEVSEIWEFPLTRNFKRYVDHFFKIKNTADKGSFKRLHAKLMLNSLYGKFGANPAKYRRNWLIPFDDAASFVNDVDGSKIVGPVGGKALIEAPILEAHERFYDVATALSITGYVRARLMRAIFENDTYYCDTDCVHVAGKFKGEIGKGLGQWAHEFKSDNGQAYAGPKLYAIRNKAGFSKFAAKGVKLPEGQEFKIIKSLCDGGEYQNKKEAPTFSLKSGRSFQDRTVRRTR